MLIGRNGKQRRVTLAQPSATCVAQVTKGTHTKGTRLKEHASADITERLKHCR